MRIVVLVSGSGSNLQALLDAVATGELDVQIAAVGSDVPECGGLQRARSSAVPTFAVPLPRGASPEQRAQWNQELCAQVSAFQPEVVVTSGFMKILSEDFLRCVSAPIINTHPALLPSFPGAHGVRDALAHGVKIAGCTVHQVDAGVDTGPILAQAAVEVRAEDDLGSLHERIKVQERRLLVETLADVAAGRIQLRAGGV
ncbi:phosphoribosylglycinamide formyltransferase [Nesterenkonia sphaerica]|uniref:Phosphoribosylglycinamide formyltransferase n=1 Tax=Nesterenkonia sphaerica TaxID=1804988 RepID=A0A5R9A5Y0_9MICC|nr:phosphoribosylglycinamide formyltransferase [Nesterenkonia sphaerica]TLP74092.1 phosphoribosylglycinamide formyltransferase [Nesterenkonia sphaerica]